MSIGYSLVFPSRQGKALSEVVIWRFVKEHKVEATCALSDLFERRRHLMGDWAVET